MTGQGAAVDGVPGMAVAAMTGGALLLWSGVTGARFTRALTSVISGTKPAGQDPSLALGGTAGITDATDPTAAGGSGSGPAVAASGATRPAIPDLGTTLPSGGEAEMAKYFGALGDSSQQTTVPFCGRSLQINKVLAANATQLGAALAAAGFTGYIRDVGGFRTSVGGSGSPIPFSMHQFGAAFDINEDGGADGNWNTMTLPAQMVSICASYGWYCGQGWSGSSRDGGHFQYVGGTGAAPIG